MEVICARSAGFCFGVARAVGMARELARSAQSPRMLGSVIHNRRVTGELEALVIDAAATPEMDAAGRS